MKLRKIYIIVSIVWVSMITSLLSVRFFGCFNETEKINDSLSHCYNYSFIKEIITLIILIIFLFPLYALVQKLRMYVEKKLLSKK
jgi:uncharacterized membrane protein